MITEAKQTVYADDISVTYYNIKLPLPPISVIIIFSPKCIEISLFLLRITDRPVRTVPQSETG